MFTFYLAIRIYVDIVYLFSICRSRRTPSYTTHTPKTVTPFSLQNMATAAKNKLSRNKVVRLIEPRTSALFTSADDLKRAVWRKTAYFRLTKRLFRVIQTKQVICDISYNADRRQS